MGGVAEARDRRRVEAGTAWTEVAVVKAGWKQKLTAEAVAAR